MFFYLFLTDFKSFFFLLLSLFNKFSCKSFIRNCVECITLGHTLKLDTGNGNIPKNYTIHILLDEIEEQSTQANNYCC